MKKEADEKNELTLQFFFSTNIAERLNKKIKATILLINFKTLNRTGNSPFINNKAKDNIAYISIDSLKYGRKVEIISTLLILIYAPQEKKKNPVSNIRYDGMYK